jgi:hypothetical protein
VPDDWDLWNYWRQLDTLAHEFAHVFGAASGEYYSLRNVPDTTATEPLENISYTDFGPTSDPYWSQHADYWHDPMMVWTPRLTWNELISQVRFANVTAAMINAGFRDLFPLSRPVPDLSATRVVVAGDSQTRLADTLVRAWKVMALPPFTSQLIFEGRTGGDGAVQFSWDGEPNNSDNVMVIKAWPNNAPPIVKWFSFYDAEEQRMVFGRTNLTIYLPALTVSGAPRITIQASASGLLVAWPTNAVGYLLQSSPSLAAPDWQPVSQTPFVEGTRQTILWTGTEAASFFRLTRY